jgi:hypothetical protein
VNAREQAYASTTGGAAIAANAGGQACANTTDDATFAASVEALAYVNTTDDATIVANANQGGQGHRGDRRCFPDFGHVCSLFEIGLIKFEIGLLKFDSSLRKLCPDRDGETIDAAYSPILDA